MPEHNGPQLNVKAVREFMKNNELSEGDMADLIGVSRITLRSYMARPESIRLETLGRISDVMKKDPLDMVDVEGNKLNREDVLDLII